MAIWRKNNLNRAGDEEEEPKTRTQLAKKKDGKKKANEEEVSLISSKIPDLNEAYDETADDAEILLPAKRMIRSDKEVMTPAAATISVYKYKTYVPPKLMVMGCTACFVYVMVPENDQVCPMCRKGTNLIDVGSDQAVHANKKRLI